MNHDFPIVCADFHDGFIKLVQNGMDNFAVIYGVQVDNELTYSQAARKLGQAIMHNAACDYQLVNDDIS